MEITNKLQELITQSSFEKVIKEIDLIAITKGKRVAVYNWQGLVYPEDESNLKIPVPDWVLGKALKPLEDDDEEIYTKGKTSNDDNNSTDNDTDNGREI